MSHSAANSTAEFETAPEKPPREFSGTTLIVGIFLFAAVMSTGLWIFWYLHTEPFQPLQRAIERAFPKSRPYVQGGQRRIHKGTPKILRITMQVRFNPESPAEQPQVEAIVTQLVDLAKQHIDFAHYNLFEVHLIQMHPEHAAHKLTITREIAKLLEKPSEP